MEKVTPKFHFPTNIKLKNPSLLEAWLEIRWQLESIEPPFLMTDPGFPFALGPFYKSIKDSFGYRADLETSKAPQDMLPHSVRHQFRKAKDQWPVLQLGPGVATVNFVGSYTWEDFRKTALYLRSRLTEAYTDYELNSQSIFLRYRNGEPCDYSSCNLLRYLGENLNTSISLPGHIPGSVGVEKFPKSIDITLTYDLSEPSGKGSLRFRTGKRGEVELLLWEIEIASGENGAPEITNEEEFSHWLNSAHDVAHEWFFSLIDGPLFERYSNEME